MQGVLGSVSFVDLAKHQEEAVDWSQFKVYLLQRMTKRTAEQRIWYAKKFCWILIRPEKVGQTLLQMSGDKRIHIMKAMASLSRFLGLVPRWQEIKQRHSLTWTTGNEKLNLFQHFFDDGKSLDSMIQWVRTAISVLPAQMGEVIKWNTTGLRPMECLQAIKLIKNPATFKTYYDADKQCLQHFKFPEIFLRRTKSAYVTIMNDELLRIAQNAPSNPSYDRIRYACTNNTYGDNLQSNCHMAYCRKVFASWLRQGGIESEIVELLQCRVPKTVFARHYFTPSLDYRDKVLCVLDRLRRDIER